MRDLVLRRQNGQLIQNLWINFTSMADKLLIGSDLVTKLDDLSFTPNVVLSLFSSDVMGSNGMSWHGSRLDKLVLR